MESDDMMPHPTSALNDVRDATHDKTFDAALRLHFQSEIEPDDNAFTERVMAALPTRPLRRSIRWVAWVEHAQLTAISLAACGVAVLTTIADARMSTAHNVAAYSLIGLLIFWAIPSRWSRG
jgi:hypothetical protein